MKLSFHVKRSGIQFKTLEAYENQPADNQPENNQPENRNYDENLNNNNNQNEDFAPQRQAFDVDAYFQ